MRFFGYNKHKPTNYNEWLESNRVTQQKPRGKWAFLALSTVVVASLSIIYGQSSEEVFIDTPAQSITYESAPNESPTSDIGKVALQAYDFVVQISTIVYETDGSSSLVATGSGVVASADGYIITNNHVVDGADKIMVRFSNEVNPVSAVLIGVAPETDLAVVKIDRSDLTYAKFSANESVNVGDLALAVGYSLAIDGLPSLTSGIISGTDRAVDTGDTVLSDLVQTDAALSSGNSGGPLLNSTGNIIGISTMVATGGETDYISNIGFAVSGDKVIATFNKLTTHGTVIDFKKGVLGIEVASRTDGGTGAIINAVRPGSAAEIAGLKQGDIVTDVNGRKVYSSTSIIGIIKELEEGSIVSVSVERELETLVFNVTLGPAIN
jgi:putative serine protease PepD